MAIRSRQTELLDSGIWPDEVLDRAYRELYRVNRMLGNTAAILRLLRAGRRNSHTAGTESRVPDTRRVLDIGCGRGALLVEIRKSLGVDVVGVDLRPVPSGAPVLILSLNAVTDRLPRADVAVCVLMAHHLSEDEFAGLIVNAARSCRRLIILDLVRHTVPLWLFRIFVRPWLCAINGADGETSIRKAFTATEMKSVVEEAIASTARIPISVRYSVAPLWIRQVVDICWE